MSGGLRIIRGESWVYLGYHLFGSLGVIILRVGRGLRFLAFWGGVKATPGAYSFIYLGPENMCAGWGAQPELTLIA